MTQKEFEERIAERRAAYMQHISELYTQIHNARKEYRAGNAALEQERKAAIKADQRRNRKSECYKLNAHILHILQEWKSEQGALDTPRAASRFNCCGSGAAVFEIVIPLRPDK